jgi:hypothetical protein
MESGRDFFDINFQFFHFFGFGCSGSDRLLAGGFVDAGEAGGEGKRFLLNGNVNLHESFWIGVFRFGQAVGGGWEQWLVVSG